jgi:hypothetical protein
MQPSRRDPCSHGVLWKRRAVRARSPFFLSGFNAFKCASIRAKCSFDSGALARNSTVVPFRLKRKYGRSVDFPFGQVAAGLTDCPSAFSSTPLAQLPHFFTGPVPGPLNSHERIFCRSAC